MEPTRQFNPEIQLDHGERGLLLATVSTEGYRIMHRIMRSEVDKFIITLINTNPSNDKEVWSNHVLAKSAAMFYEAITRRINEEIIQYTGAPRATDVPYDATEAILDIGEVASTRDDVYRDVYSLEEGIDE